MDNYTKEYAERMYELRNIYINLQRAKVLYT